MEGNYLLKMLVDNTDSTDVVNNRPINIFKYLFFGSSYLFFFLIFFILF